MSARVASSGILFAGHCATRNGAPIALLHFLRWYKANGGRRFSVLLDADGPLAGDYAGLADTWAADLSHWCPGGARSKLLGSVGLGSWGARAERADVRRFAARSVPALVYLNSAASASARLIEMLDAEIPVLTHVHELEFLLRVQAGPALPLILSRTSRFVACSNAVKENLVSGHGVAADRVDTVHESIPVERIRARRSREEVLRELRLPDGALLVTASGAPEWRKGADLFVQLARAVCRERSRVFFAWVGGGFAWQDAQFEEDIRLARLTERVRLTGVVSDPADFFAATDVFLLTSREDPYPLVCLEAAALGKPIVCFADSGGMPEFVEEDCGYIVPYLDIAAMAERVIHLLDSPECRLRVGEAARRKVTERHDIGVAAPRIADIIERTVAEGRSR